MKFLVCLALAVVAASVVEAHQIPSYSFPIKLPFVKPGSRARVWGGKYSVDDDAYDELDSDFSTTTAGPSGPHHPHRKHKMLKKKRAMRRNQRHPAAAASHSLDDDAYDELDSDFSTITPGPLGPHHPSRKQRMLKKKRAMRRNQRHPAAAASHSLDDDAYDELDSDFSVYSGGFRVPLFANLIKPMKPLMGYPKTPYYSLDDDAYDELDSDFSTMTAGPSGTQHPGHRRIHPFHHHRKGKKSMKVPRALLGPRKVSATAGHSLDDSAFGELD